MLGKRVENTQRVQRKTKSQFTIKVYQFIIVDPCLSTPLLAQQLHQLQKSLWWGSFLQRYPWNSRPTWPARRCHRLLLFPLYDLRVLKKTFGDLKGHFWGSYNWSCQGLQRDTACTFGCLLLQSLLEHVLQVENLLESLNKHLSTNVQCIPRLCHSILCNLLRNPNFFEDTWTQATCSWNLLLQAS